MASMTPTQIESRQEAITLLNMLIRHEITGKSDIQTVLEQLRTALEHYRI